MALLVGYLVLALFVSFVCSVLESILLTAPASYSDVLRRQARVIAASPMAELTNKEQKSVSRAVRRKIKSALLLKNMKTDLEKPLSAVLSLNTVAHTVGAAGVGAQSLEVFGDVYVGVTSAILTLCILIFSEILPKSVGTRYWKNIIVPSCYMIQAMVVICYPLVWLSKGITYVVAKKTDEPTVSRQEVEAVVNMGSKEGVFAEEEVKSLRSMLEVNNMRVRDVMTPRIVAVTVSEETTLRDFFRKKNYLKYSRIPVHQEGNPDHITGFVLLKNVFMQLAEDKFDKKLSSVRRPVMISVDSQRVLNLWEQMRRRKEQIAMVVDEYGSFVGIVTMEDLVETMLGREIVDEKDTITDLQDYARKKGKNE